MGRRFPRGLLTPALGLSGKEDWTRIGPAAGTKETWRPIWVSATAPSESSGRPQAAIPSLHRKKLCWGGGGISRAQQKNLWEISAMVTGPLLRSGLQRNLSGCFQGPGNRSEYCRQGPSPGSMAARGWNGEIQTLTGAPENLVGLRAQIWAPVEHK